MKILLVCNAGMSTSILVREMEKAAKEQYDKAKALADAKANLAKIQLDKYIFDLS